MTSDEIEVKKIHGAIAERDVMAFKIDQQQMAMGRILDTETFKSYRTFVNSLRKEEYYAWPRVETARLIVAMAVLHNLKRPGVTALKEWLDAL